MPEVDWTDENKKHLVDAMADEITKHGRLADNGTWKTEQLRQHSMQQKEVQNTTKHNCRLK